MYLHNKTIFNELLAIEHDGQESVWHTAAMDVLPGNYSLVFEFTHGSQLAPENAGLDDINIRNGKCHHDTESMNVKSRGTNTPIDE